MCSGDNHERDYIFGDVEEIVFDDEEEDESSDTIRSLSEDARLIEVILFLENEPVSVDKFVKMTDLNEDEVMGALAEIEEYYDTYRHGMSLFENHGAFQFLPSSDLHERLRSCYGRRVDRRLSRRDETPDRRYSQPITRREIDNIRESPAIRSSGFSGSGIH